MNKHELIESIAVATGETKRTVGAVLAALPEVLAQELINGGEVTLTGIGKFSTMTTAPRTGRNPKTGEPTAIPSFTKPKFKASTVLKQALN